MLHLQVTGHWEMAKLVTSKHNPSLHFLSFGSKKYQSESRQEGSVPHDDLEERDFTGKSKILIVHHRIQES